MKRMGPLLTLAVGVVVAAVLMVLNLNATNAANSTAQPDGVADTATTQAAKPTETPKPDPTPTTAAAVVPAGPPVTYAGPVDGGTATIAIAVTGEQAIAYLCDGASAEAWLQGTAQNGQLRLAGPDNANLTGTFGNGVATGVAVAAGLDFSFSVGTVQEPSGLYRASANVANATIVGGWIVLPNGTQVGTQRNGNSITPAAPLNVANRSSTLGGTTVTVTAVDGTKL